MTKLPFILKKIIVTHLMKPLVVNAVKLPTLGSQKGSAQQFNISRKPQN
jgi:hypothetical protein